jgi:hypothetical protein
MRTTPALRRLGLAVREHQASANIRNPATRALTGARPAEESGYDRPMHPDTHRSRSCALGAPEPNWMPRRPKLIFRICRPFLVSCDCEIFLTDRKG